MVAMTTLPAPTLLRRAVRIEEEHENKNREEELSSCCSLMEDDDIAAYCVHDCIFFRRVAPLQDKEDPPHEENDETDDPNNTRRPTISDLLLWKRISTFFGPHTTINVNDSGAFEFTFGDTRFSAAMLPSGTCFKLSTVVANSRMPDHFLPASHSSNIQLEQRDDYKFVISYKGPVTLLEAKELHNFNAKLVEFLMMAIGTRRVK